MPNIKTRPGLLTFGSENAKLEGQSVITFSLPAGFTCPGANECMARFNRDIGKIEDGPNMKFRCFAASQEAAFPSVRKSRDRNMQLLREARTTGAMAALISRSLEPFGWKNVRIHVSGDFYSPAYFTAWCDAARNDPSREFYGYTKSLKIWADNKHLVPDNLTLTASIGGKWDSLASTHGLRTATVVMHPDVAVAMNLEIDHDDSHARSKDGKNFALLLHGTQPPNSIASAARKRMEAEGIKFSYPKTKTKSKDGHVEH